MNSNEEKTVEWFIVAPRSNTVNRGAALRRRGNRCSSVGPLVEGGPDVLI